MVLNFWENVRKGGEGVISNPKMFIANLRKLMHIYEKRNEDFQNKGGQGRLDFFLSQKNINFGAAGRS